MPRICVDWVDSPRFVSREPCEAHHTPVIAVVPDGMEHRTESKGIQGTIVEKKFPRENRGRKLRTEDSGVHGVGGRGQTKNRAIYGGSELPD